MKRDLIFIDRVKREFANTVDFETFSLKHSIYFRIANGFTNWRWVFGHQVT